jgi:hypothetical protein
MTAKPPPLAEPISIAKIWKSRNHTEHVRVDLSEHMGHPLINVRIWRTGSDGIDRPTVKGVAMAVRKLPELSNALRKALEKARALNLLPEDSGE